MKPDCSPAEPLFFFRALRQAPRLERIGSWKARS